VKIRDTAGAKWRISGAREGKEKRQLSRLEELKAESAACWSRKIRREIKEKGGGEKGNYRWNTTDAE